MNYKKRQYATESVLEEESCATCKYWRGRWRGEIDERSIKNWMIYDTYSFSTDSSQFTYGECRRFPPTQPEIEKVRKYVDQIRWQRWLEIMEKQHNDTESRICEAEKEKIEAEKVANEHPELWDRQMTEAKVAKLDKEIKKLQRQIENSTYATQEQQWAELERMAPKESVRRGRWIRTTQSGWCGEYKRDKDKTDMLINDLCCEDDWD